MGYGVLHQPNASRRIGAIFARSKNSGCCGEKIGVVECGLVWDVRRVLSDLLYLKIRRGTQVAQGRGLQNLHSWVRIPPAPPGLSRITTRKAPINLLAGIGLSRGTKAVHLQIQFQDIHVRFAKKSQVAPPGMSLHQRAHVLFFHAARMCTGAHSDAAFNPQSHTNSTASFKLNHFWSSVPSRASCPKPVQEALSRTQFLSIV